MTLHCMADHGIKADIMTLQVDGPESAFSKGGRVLKQECDR